MESLFSIILTDYLILVPLFIIWLAGLIAAFTRWPRHTSLLAHEPGIHPILHPRSGKSLDQVLDSTQRCTAGSDEDPVFDSQYRQRPNRRPGVDFNPCCCVRLAKGNRI